MKSLRPWTFAVILATAACSGAETPPATDGSAETPPANADNVNPDLTLTADDLKSEAETITLVPSPVETQKALEAAGIDMKLADLIQPKEYKLDQKDTDDVAVRTGVTIADMLLTVKTASDEQLLDHLARIKEGMVLLNGGADIASTINDLDERIRAKAVNRDELLKELDELSGAIIPELEFNGVDRVVPLISAGSWLEGSNLVAKACKQANNPTAADNLLKQPAVVDYFIKYVKTEGKEKAPAAVTQKLEESLNALKELAVKGESLTIEDMDTVIKVTHDVLALL